MNRQMAHRHEALLGQPCAACKAEPLVQLTNEYLYPADVSEWLKLVAAGIVMAMILFAFIWLVLVQA